jgi:hypothetical protein
MNLKCLILIGSMALWSAARAPGQSDGDAYDEGQFGGSSYVQHGSSPAYGGAYAQYGGRNMHGITGRFNSSYGEYGAIPGYGELGAGAGYGTGANRGAGTGYGKQGEPPIFNVPHISQKAAAKGARESKPAEPSAKAQERSGEQKPAAKQELKVED